MALQKNVAAANRLCLPPRQGTVRHGFDYFPPGSDFFLEGSAATLPYQKSRFRRGKGIANLPQVVTDIFRVNKAIVIQVVFSPFPFTFLVAEDHARTDVFQRLDLTTAPFPATGRVLHEELWYPSIVLLPELPQRDLKRYPVLSVRSKAC